MTNGRCSLLLREGPRSHRRCAGYGRTSVSIHCSWISIMLSASGGTSSALRKASAAHSARLRPDVRFLGLRASCMLRRVFSSGRRAASQPLQFHQCSDARGLDIQSCACRKPTPPSSNWISAKARKLNQTAWFPPSFVRVQRVATFSSAA